MTAPEFTVGELVDIHIIGAKVIRTWPHANGQDLWVSLNYERTTADVTLKLGLDTRNVTVERVAPVGWPPQADDLWADRDGEEWHALARFNGEPLMAIDAEAVTQEPADLLARFGPLRLVRRREPVTEDREAAS